MWRAALLCALALSPAVYATAPIGGCSSGRLSARSLRRATRDWLSLTRLDGSAARVAIMRVPNADELRVRLLRAVAVNSEDDVLALCRSNDVGIDVLPGVLAAAPRPLGEAAAQLVLQLCRTEDLARMAAMCVEHAAFQALLFLSARLAEDMGRALVTTIIENWDAVLASARQAVHATMDLVLSAVKVLHIHGYVTHASTLAGAVVLASKPTVAEERLRTAMEYTVPTVATDLEIIQAVGRAAAVRSVVARWLSPSADASTRALCLQSVRTLVLAWPTIECSRSEAFSHAKVGVCTAALLAALIPELFVDELMDGAAVQLEDVYAARGQLKRVLAKPDMASALLFDHAQLLDALYRRQIIHTPMYLLPATDEPSADSPRLVLEQPEPS